MSEQYISTAKVIDGILILSLPDAISPVVWQMELGQSKSSALEIRNTAEGTFTLTLKTPRQDVLDIATYADRDLAIKALLVASAALERGQLKAGSSNGYPVPAVSNTYRSSSCKSTSGVFCVFKKILSVIGMIFGALVLLAIISFVIGKLFISTPSTTTSASNSAPVSADEFLENR